MNEFMKIQKQIETKVVSGYQGIENAVVNGYKKIENKFVEAFLTPDDIKCQAKKNKHE